MIKKILVIMLSKNWYLQNIVEKITHEFKKILIMVYLPGKNSKTNQNKTH